MKTNLDHLLDALETNLPDWFAAEGLPPFRVGQLRKWLYQRRASGFDEMTDLPKQVRARLGECFQVWSMTVVKHSVSPDGTEKMLLQLHDGGQIECVLLREGHRRTICLSSQVGCAMGCVFCASGLDGVQRNLTSGEMVEQMLLLQRLLPDDERLSHIVMMGMGEPLANLKNVLPTLDAACREDGLGISARRVTISTVGLPAGMQELRRAQTNYNLAVSLHAPDDALRNQLVPVNQRTGLHDILREADQYFEASGRRLTFEYVLLAGVNDSTAQAEHLATLLKGRPALINLIPYNRVEGLPYQTPTSAAVRRFRDVLEQAGLQVRCRQRKGDKINAACGQLRRASTKEAPQ